MDCKGTVTDVNSKFLFFKLDNRIKVHMSILLTQNTSLKLPKVGSKVTVKNAHRQSTTYSVCNSSILDGDFTVEYERNFFYDLVNNYKLGFTDLLKIDGIIDVLDKFTILFEDLKINLIKSILRYIIQGLNNVYCDEDVCTNKHMCSVNFIIVSKCRYIEIQPETNKFVNFPHWSFGVHLKPTEGTLLFGYIKMQPGYGFFLLKDHLYQIPCVIYNTTSDLLQSVENTYVLIKNYRVFTEIYQENSIPSIEYLLIDFNDIHVIYEEKSNDGLFGKDVPTQQFNNNICFQLIRKSMVCIGNNKKPECWLQILVKTKGVLVSLNEIFLIVPSSYVKIVMYFEEGQTYRLFYNQALKETQNIELTRIKKIKIYELQENLAYFQKLNEVDEAKTHLTVKECKEYVSNHTELVSFEGILKGRRFASALPSRTIKRSNIYGFGMPGSKVHQLVFSIDDNGRKLFLDCYLNNWENVLMPLGLIPQMKLIVRNVYPQSKKYLKSSVFTTFEIVAYEPLIDFETVNLYENNQIQWGTQCFLGQGNKIPHGVLVWGKVSNIQILSVKMDNQCSNCKFINENPGLCERCEGDRKDFNFLVKMHVSDEYGQSKVLAKYPEIMKIFLDLQDHQFKIWLRAFKEIGQYEYSFFEEIETVDHILERSCFKNSLTEFLKTVNKRGMLFLDLKCRKLDCDPQKNGGRPLWFCVDARRS